MTINRVRSRRGPLLVIALILTLSAVIASSVTGAQEAPVGLGTSDSFAVLAGAGVMNTGPSVISGNLGTCPTPAATGFPPGTVINGTIHAADAVCLQAQSDLTIAYNDAAGRPPTITYPGVKDLGGQTLAPGVYKADAFAITGTLTLDAQGDPDAVWIFQAGSTLITAPDSRVVLINSAQPCNVFWQVGSSATLGVNSTFVGTILALTAITANTNAAVQGRLLARNAAVTLDSNTVTRPVCAPAPTTTSSTTSSSTTSSTTAPTTTSTTTPLPTTVPPITLPPTTLPPITLPPITVPPITVPPITVPPITLPPTTLPPVVLPTTTTSTSSTLPATTTTTALQPTTTTTLGNITEVVDIATTTTSVTSTTSVAAGTTTASTASTTVGGGSATGAGSTTATLSSATTAGGGGVQSGGAASAASAGALARTGSSMAWARFWAGVALTLGAVMVLLARPDPRIGRRRGSRGW